MHISINKCDERQRKPIPTDEANLGFGTKFSDHMFLAYFDDEQGWHDARIEPYRQLWLDPATTVLHYGQSVFEGMKAYRGRDGGIRLFRYMKNFERLNRSCVRLCIPNIPADLFESALKRLVLLERDWIPKTEGCALYIRPTVIAIDPFLGVRPSKRYVFYVIVGPVGAYYAEGFNPVRIWCSHEFVRAVRGGVGEAKTAANYAASLRAQQTAQQAGYTQVLWLDAIERKYVEEVGTMNIFFKIDGEVITSPLTGSILPGITRDSTIQLLGHWGIPVTQRRLSIDEVFEAGRAGKLEEVFGTGTAAIVSPVGAIGYKEDELKVADGKTGELANRLYQAILGMQYGYADDPFGWTERIA